MGTITTELYEDADELVAGMGEAAARGGGAVVLFALGLEPASLLPFAAAVDRGTSVFLADSYGILGYSAKEGRNLERMEQGRGTEYGGVGGHGGSGVVAVIFDDDFEGTTSTLPDKATAHLSVAAHGSDITSFLRSRATAPFYGGVAKWTYRYDTLGARWEAVPHFFVSAKATVGTTSFTDEAIGSIRELLDELPAGQTAGTVGLFPCFMRGVNEYGEDDVEPKAVSELLPESRIYGMFCHGELGPRRCLGFAPGADPQKTCGQHSMTTIVAVHTTP